MSHERNHAGHLTRRKALKKIAGTAGAAVAFPILSSGTPAHSAHSTAALRIAAGPTPYTAKFFSAGQMETIASLAEAIIPADEHSPGARAARVHEFIDTMLAESSQARKDDWVKGLSDVDLMAAHKYQKRFAECTLSQQQGLLLKMSENEGHPTTPEEHFFAAIKNATIEGYYTSEIGIHQELEYQGNTALGEFEGCGHLPHKIENQ